VSLICDFNRRCYKYFLLLTALIFANSLIDSFCQEEPEEELSSQYSIFGSASLYSGLRVGGRIQFFEQISFEGSWGKDILNFIAPSDPNYRYSIGLNYYTDSESNFIINFTYTHPYYPSDFIVDQHFFLLNLGILPNKQKGINLFYDAGVGLKLDKNLGGNDLYYLINLQIGIGYWF
jgi:hypothetical protein